ncbi:hypothetical protein N836_04250 [Leptolyngbya sp. Heron Island J]|nr:hypothetical protein N836_04250 [Leptolyngbya sp. Heron Island J]
MASDIQVLFQGTRGLKVPFFSLKSIEEFTDLTRIENHSMQYEERFLIKHFFKL